MAAKIKDFRTFPHLAVKKESKTLSSSANWRWQLQLDGSVCFVYLCMEGFSVFPPNRVIVLCL
jgi:hypothetical protein